MSLQGILEKSKGKNKLEISTIEAVKEKTANIEIEKGNIINNEKTTINENEEKLKRALEPLVQFEQESIQEAVRLNDTSKLRQKGIKKKKGAEYKEVTNINKEQFLDYKTFIPRPGNLSGLEKAPSSNVSLSIENDRFLKLIAYNTNGRITNILNHMVDIIRTYHKELNK